MAPLGLWLPGGELLAMGWWIGVGLGNSVADRRGGLLLLGRAEEPFHVSPGRGDEGGLGEAVMSGISPLPPKAKRPEPGPAGDAVAEAGRGAQRQAPASLWEPC